MKNIKNKWKIILLLISILIIIASVSIFKNYNNSSKKNVSCETRVKTNINVEEKKATDKSKDEEKNTAVKKDSTILNDKKDEEKVIEDKKEKNDSKNSVIEDNAKKSDEDKNKETNNQTNNVSETNETNETNEVSVYMRVEGYDGTVVPRTKISTKLFDLNSYLGRASGSSATPSNGWGTDKFKEPTVAHALVKLLEDNGFNHGNGYDLQDYGWGLYIAMINGDREFDHRNTSGWMYRVNDVLPNIGCQGKPIKGGEEILWYFGAYGFDTLVTEMKASSNEVVVGQPITITLNGIKNDINTWQEFREPAENATIYVNGKPYTSNSNEIKTNKEGKAELSFDKPGEYILSAERINSKDIKDLLRPLPVFIKVK